MIQHQVRAEDECIRLTCAEVLSRLGLAASAGDWPPRDRSGTPDAILVWEMTEADIVRIRAAYGEVPLLVCTWRHGVRWPEPIRIVRLPFNAERVTRIVQRTIAQLRAAPGRGSR
jgi:hypothetical protein